MRVLFAVLDDLFNFALHSLFGFVAISDKRKIVEELPAPLQPLLPLLPSSLRYSPADVELVSAQGSYFVSAPNAAVRIDPVSAFDNVLTILHYGTQITVLKYGGRWAMVQTKNCNGWILKDDICSSAAEVFPSFHVGGAYDADNVTTKKVRLLLKDMFACSEPALPLTSAEYVTYRLYRSHRQIDWPTKRPRLAGQWQSILRGQGGVHLGVTPKTGSVMEYIEDEQGLLLYVEAVFPDDSIQVSAVDYEGVGVYSESVLPKEQWRELRPVFIQVL